MTTTLCKDVRRLSLLAAAEGWTLLLLLGLAVPAKYLAGWPMAVRILGPIHGVTFLALVASSIEVAVAHGWSFRRWLALAGAALLPGGGFAIARRLRRSDA